MQSLTHTVSESFLNEFLENCHNTLPPNALPERFAAIAIENRASVDMKSVFELMHEFDLTAAEIHLERRHILCRAVQ